MTVDSLGRVVSLDLSANNLLAERFPGSILNLAELRALDISDNPEFRGRLPLALSRVPLEAFRFAGTGVCSPEGLRKWLSEIPEVTGTGLDCPPVTDRDILAALYEATDGMN